MITLYILILHVKLIIVNCFLKQFNKKNNLTINTGLMANTLINSNDIPSVKCLVYGLYLTVTSDIETFAKGGDYYARVNLNNTGCDMYCNVH